MKYAIYDIEGPPKRLAFVVDEEPSDSDVRHILGKSENEDVDYEVFEIYDLEDWKEKIRGEWNFDTIRQAIKDADVVENEQDCFVRSVYLGQLINPSGKYYMPFACSNVLGDCPVCKGTGEVLNPTADEKAYEELTAQLEALVSEMTAQYGYPIAWPQPKRDERSELVAEIDKVKPHLECPACQGEGSASACNDEDWREAFTAVLDEFDEGLCLQNGEGDPCDYFVVQYVPEPEEEEDDA